MFTRHQYAVFLVLVAYLAQLLVHIQWFERFWCLHLDSHFEFISDISKLL